MKKFKKTYKKLDPRTKEIIEIVVYIFLGYLIAISVNKGLAYSLDTDYPVVAVVSRSMEHYDAEETFYPYFEGRDFSREEVEDFSFPSGLRMGDIVAVRGVEFENIKIGDVIVYKFPGKAPIIHRVVEIKSNGLYTKGDNNNKVDQEGNAIALPIKKENLQGKAVLHIPLLGYVKIAYLKVTGQ